MTYDRQSQIREMHARRRAATDKRANGAIDALLREGLPVNFNRVAEASGVSVATLYKHESVRARIERLRDGVRALPSARDAKPNTSDAGKDALIASLRRKVARLERENAELRGALESSLAEQWREL